MRKNKVVFCIVLIIAFVILIELVQYVTNGVQRTKLNNMYIDIKMLDNRITLYYLDNGDLPTKSQKIDFIDKSINPNDNENFYEIDMSKLENLELSYGKRNFGEKDFYLINENSHTIYYYSGIEFEDEIYYTRKIIYKKAEI